MGINLLAKSVSGAPDFRTAATLLGVSEAHIRAVDIVESAGAGFDASLRIKLLFEPHKFRDATQGKYDQTHSWLSHKYDTARNRISYKRNQYEVFAEAAALDTSCAIMACSWGRYQILGSHYKALGFESPFEFLEQNLMSENQQLVIFCQFLKINPPMLTALKASDWAGFARRYNGQGYAINAYDTKLEAAFKKVQLIRKSQS